MASTPAKLNWLQAYLQFLRSPQESILLKIAPLIIIGVIPVDLLSNILPVVGLVDDVGLSGIGILTVIRTLWHVNKYRNPTT
jgi:uncharacterized membrane protein YkvA (DUF1232 family)